MTTLTVKFANPAAEGKKFGSIVDTAGNRYPCPAAIVSQFQKGQTYEVALKKETWSGNQVQVIGGAPSNGNAAPAPAPAGHNRSPVQSGNGQTKDAAMFVMGVVGRAMGSGKFDTQDIPLLAKAAAAAWNEVKGSL